jgi:hypothetical protein
MGPVMGGVPSEGGGVGPGGGLGCVAARMAGRLGPVGIVGPDTGGVPSPGGKAGLVGRTLGAAGAGFPEFFSIISER